MKKTKCYIYTRVSTAIQVDGYSLDAQKDKIRKYAENSIKGFTGRGCLLHLFVKVVPEWRNDERRLKEYGYKE